MLICDHPKRELKSLLKLRENLEKSNIETKIINKNLIVKAYNLYKPKIITIPHTLSTFYNPIDQLKGKVTLAVIPTESSIFVDKFIEMFYCNKFEKFTKKSNHNKIDIFFTQSKFISNYLKSKKLIKRKMVNTGFLYYDYWYDSLKNTKKIKQKQKKIGIALSLSSPFSWYKSKDFILNYYNADKEFGYYNNSWRISEVRLG